MTAAGLGDRFGRRRVFTAGLWVFAAASAACALAPDVGWLIAARALQGVGAALVMPLAVALLAAAFPPKLRPKALGVFTGVAGLSVGLGPLLGGAVSRASRGRGSSGSTCRPACSSLYSCAHGWRRASAPTPPSTGAASRSSPAGLSASSGGSRAG